MIPTGPGDAARHLSSSLSADDPERLCVLSEAAIAAAKTNTFFGERYRRLMRRRGKIRALVAIARSILVTIWHLLADPTAHFIDLGFDFYERCTNNDRRTRQLVRQLQALGHEVTLTPAA